MNARVSFIDPEHMIYTYKKLRLSVKYYSIHRINVNKIISSWVRGQKRTIENCRKHHAMFRFINRHMHWLTEARSTMHSKLNN